VDIMVHIGTRAKTQKTGAKVSAVLLLVT
jgi:hypothetical protein